MNERSPTSIRVAIACGGTGGHLFPGLAVAERLLSHGCAVTLLISPKEVDQEAVKVVKNMNIVTLPAVGLAGGQRIAFFRGMVRSYRAAKREFRENPIRAALAMGGFTSAPPIVAARRLGARTFLHESNSIPGRANRWLSRVVDRAFVGFKDAAPRLRAKNVTVTGTPVRPEFEQVGSRAQACRAALGFDPSRPVALVMGGSQGAAGINALVERSLSALAGPAREWQWFHLTGPADAERMKRAYSSVGIQAVVYPFFSQMDLALGAATVAVSRAGASSLAELAAVQVPSLLVPYPAAVDNHQFFNARAFEQSGAARLLEQKSATPELFSKLLLELVSDANVRCGLQKALAQWHAPNAAEEIAAAILQCVGVKADGLARAAAPAGSAGNARSDLPSGSALSRLPSELERTAA